MLLALGSSGAWAQTAALDTTQRDVNQQTRIENGLKDGQLSTGEAGHLEKQESRIDNMQAQDLKKGAITPKERAQLRKAQDRASRDIARDTHNGVKGNPDSASSERMQADVQRNINQEKRINQGIQSGALTNREAGNLQRGQARVDRRQARAARNGQVGARAQAGIQRAENRNSHVIAEEKHNAETRGGKK